MYLNFSFPAALTKVNEGKITRTTSGALLCNLLNEFKLHCRERDVNFTIIIYLRSSLGESIPSITSSQDSLAPIGLYQRPTGMPNAAESPSASSIQLQQQQQQPQNQRTEQHKKKGIKSSLGKFFSSKKEKAGKSSKDSLSSTGNSFTIYIICVVSSF